MQPTQATEIIATLGPASWRLAEDLCGAGAGSLRLNASHMAASELGRWTAELRAARPDCPLVVDLQGAKMRLGHFAERPVGKDEVVIFAHGENNSSLPIPHAELFSAVRPGETLSCDDDRLRFRVEQISPGELRARSLGDGVLRPRKGVNILEHPVSMTDLSDFDLECIRVTNQYPPVAYAYSFMKDGSEAEWVRRRVPASRVYGKIERREAADQAGRIASAVDGIWICRGDLGAQLGQARMARWISGFDPRRLPCPVFMAGQVLEHMTGHAEPTRSEVCHVYDLVARGYAGFVLSDETAIGADPIAAVAALRGLLSAF